MKIKNKKHIKTLILISILLIFNSILVVNSMRPPKRWINNLPETYRLISESFNPTLEYAERKNIYLIDSNKSDGFYAQSTRVYLNQPVNEETFQSPLDKVNNREDCADFRMNSLVRTMYLDNIAGVLEPTFKSQIKDAILGFKYWFTEPGEDEMIMWTENHMILFHTAELLAGQLYKNEIFPNSQMTGIDHINHALPLVNRWIEWRARFGFSEWHSNIYFNEDLLALLNLVEFAEDIEVSTKAAMLVDQLCLDFAMNYFKGTYATTHGRTDDGKKTGTSLTDPPSRDNIAEFVWISLGLGYHDPNNGDSKSAVALVTSDKYEPPPILEVIAQSALDFNEHKERSSINIVDGPNYGFGYKSEEDLMFWWPMSAVFAAPTIEGSLNLTEYYDLNPNLVFEDEMLVDLLKLSADLYGLSISEICEFLKEATQGIVLEEVNTYTYRTPHYQLSGAQDHQKGMGGYQEHIWQASLDEYTFIYTNSHGGFRGEDFVGGFNPRATLYKNVGIIQYDRLSQSLILELVYLILGFEPITQAYFPRWAFDEVLEQDKWIFGRRGESYVALYSYEPTSWKSDYELISLGKKNLYIVELGSIAEYASFEDFISSILANSVMVKHLSVGYSIEYTSPSQGLVKVAWDGPMNIDGQDIDLGPYPRFDNDFCYQEFNTHKTTIQFGNQILELDFETITRNYTET